MTPSSTTVVAPVRTSTPALAPQPENTSAPAKPKWQRFVVPTLVVLLAAAIVATINWNWNAWEGGRVEQVTDDAYVRGDITPLSTHRNVRARLETVD